jgi:hypothetical protein
MDSALDSPQPPRTSVGDCRLTVVRYGSTLSSSVALYGDGDLDALATVLAATRRPTPVVAVHASSLSATATSTQAPPFWPLRVDLRQS